MNIRLLLHTLSHLKFRQIFYQVLYRIHKAHYVALACPHAAALECADFIEKYDCLDVTARRFTFINIPYCYTDWNETKNGMLWAYNLNYMDWLGQKGLSFDEGAKWIDLFIKDLPKNNIGLDPYPIALRSLNWIKFICQHQTNISEGRLGAWNDSLYSQVKLLERKLEFHLLGNHLLEDLYALYIASLYFHDEALYQKVARLLMKELDEEVLADGMHYEQSPMYHCILLDRLLDCYNFSTHNVFFEQQEEVNAFLLSKAKKMLGHLSHLIYADGSIPLLNDSAFGIAPTAQQLFAYAQRLDIAFEAVPFSECGYRKFKNECFEAIVDVGNITSTYQPGHTHADTFNFELRIDGQPFMVDTGISTYNKTARRQYERSTAAHNTVTINDCDSSEVWGGFRVGKRAKVTLLADDNGGVKAQHTGFGCLGTHKRRFELKSDAFIVKDEVSGSALAKSMLHFSASEEILSSHSNQIITTHGIIYLDGAEKVEIIDEKVSERYNEFIPIKKAIIHFRGKLNIRITKK